MQKDKDIADTVSVRLAALAEWEPNEAARAALAADFAEMLSMLSDLDDVDDTLGTPVAALPLTALRADVAAPSLSREEALAGAPLRQGEYIAVPRVVE